MGPVTAVVRCGSLGVVPFESHLVNLSFDSVAMTQMMTRSEGGVDSMIFQEVGMSSFVYCKRERFWDKWSPEYVVGMIRHGSQ